LSTLSKYDVFVDGKYHGIIDKLINLESITTLYKSQDYYKIQTNDKRLKPEKTNTIKCYVSKQKDLKNILILQK
jgi:hypothetical protein